MQLACLYKSTKAKRLGNVLGHLSVDGQDTMMSLSNVSWEAEFRKLFEVGSDRYQQGKREVSSFFQPEELELLQRIGYRAQEMFDFLEDHVNYGAPDYATAYKVAVLRERYFREVQGGEWTGQVVAASQLPAKTDTMDGVAWFPRLVAKARAKLAGELDEPTMYGCAGDRPFLAGYGHTLDSFLEIVWKHGENDEAILQALRQRP